MAKPIADSAAATAKTNKAKICPTKSSKKTEKHTKFKFKDNNVNSNDINIRIKLFLFKTIPKIPIKNNKKLKFICKLNIYFIIVYF